MSRRSGALRHRKCAILRARPWDLIATRCSLDARSCPRRRSSPICKRSSDVRPGRRSVRPRGMPGGCRLPHDLTRDVTRGAKTPRLREERMRPLLRGALGAALLYALVPQAQAQTFPDRAIPMVVPYGTGGITDIAARILSPRLGEELGQQVFVDN